ncbi:hypothetical protein Tco_1159899 [Tanacetum coccineum]
MYPRFLQLFLNNQIALAEPFNDVYQTPAHTKKVFTNMKRKGKDFSRRVTPLFASMLAPPVVEGEGSCQPSEPQPAPSTAQPIIEEHIPFPQTSVPIPNVADEAVFKEWDNKVVRATTTAASLDAIQASGNISKTQSTAMSNDPLSQELVQGSCLGTIKDCSRFGDQQVEKESQKIGKEAKGKNSRDETLQDCDFAELDVDNAMESVEGDAETQGRNTAKQITTNGDTVNTASIDVSIADPFTSTTGDIFEDEMMTIADTLVAIRSTRPRTT